MNLSKIKKFSRGFTLIEILLVVAILSILLVVVFASLNPAQRLADTRDARRWNDVNQVLTAIHECLVDNGGTYATCGVANDGVAKEIVNTGVATGCNDVCLGVDQLAAGDDDCADLETSLVSAAAPYLGSLPVDPGDAAADHTEYMLTVNNGIVTVSACSAEGDPISVSR